MTVTFDATVRPWHEDKPGGLAVIDVPDNVVGELGADGRCASPARSTPSRTPAARCW
jgi:hypothetical protein